MGFRTIIQNTDGADRVHRHPKASQCFPRHVFNISFGNERYVWTYVV